MRQTNLKLWFIIILFSCSLYGQGVKKNKVIQTYKSVKIGKHVWMIENLNVAKYRNGDPIPEVKDSTEWANLTTGAWCYYENDPKNGKKYGKLYNWYAVNDPRGLTPKGWHIPTKAEFAALKASVNNDGNALKSIGQGIVEGEGTDASGFSALLSGYRYGSGAFGSLGTNTNFWASSELNPTSASTMELSSDSNVYLYVIDEEYGFSVRCVQD